MRRFGKVLSIKASGGVSPLLPVTERTIPRIAIVFEYGTLNGGEHSMLAVIDRLQDAGFEFVALAPQTGRLADAFQDRNLIHIPLQLRDEMGNRLSREQACGNLREAIRRCSPHLVHANSLAMGRLTGAIAEEIKIPCIAHLRDIIKLSKAAVADLNRNRRLIAVSEATKKFHAAQGLNAEKTCVVYNGVDCERFQPRNSTGCLKQKLNVPNDAFLIATIGQIGLRKGQDVLSEAAAISAARLSNAYYLLIGERNSSKTESIEFERNIIRRFAEAGLEKRLCRLGYRNDVAGILNEIDLLVHPAKQEPLGRVLLEAAAAGVPIIATDVGGTGEIFRDGISARLIPPNNPQELAEAIVELSTDLQTRKRLAEQARQRVEEHFNIEHASDELSSLWLNLAPER
jgi:glycosyltransferase involved in cell wall biosynthesis